MAILDILEGKSHHESYTLFLEQSFPADLVQEAFHQMELQVWQPGTDRWLVPKPPLVSLVDGGNLHFLTNHLEFPKRFLELKRHVDDPPSISTKLGGLQMMLGTFMAMNGGSNVKW